MTALARDLAMVALFLLLAALERVSGAFGDVVNAALEFLDSQPADQGWSSWTQQWTIRAS